MTLQNSPIILDLVLKSTAVLLLAFAVQCLWRHASAARRGFIWLATFAVLALLPLTLLVKPRLALDWLPPTKVATPTLALPEIKVSAALPDSASVPQQLMRKPAIQISAGEKVAAIWLIGALLVLAHRVAGAVRLRHVLQRVKSIENISVQSRASALALDCGITRGIALFQSDFVPVPVTWGTIRPALLLPEASLHWENARLDAALRHELGHIRHFDSAKRLLAQLVCAVHWFNPLVWFAARSWRMVQEQACDDLVLRSGADAENHAMQLLQAVQSLGDGCAVPAAALAMAKPSTLETRLCAIVDDSRDRRPVSRMTRIAGTAFGLLTLALSATMQLRAEDKATGKPPDPAAKGDIILIESRVVEGPAGTMRSIMGGVTPAPGFSVITSQEQTAGILGRLTTTKGVDVLSSPRVTAVSGQQATVEVGREIATDPADPKKTAFVGIKIALLPTLSEKIIDLDIKASVSEQTGVDQGRPLIRAREVASRIKIAPGATLLLSTEFGVKESGPKEIIFLVTARLAEQQNHPEARPAPDGKPMTTTADSISLDPNKRTARAAGGVTIETAHGTAKGETATAQIRVQQAAVKSTAQKRAETLIFPRIVFHEASLDEALEFLRIKGKEFDSEKLGVNILLIHGPDSRSAKLTLDLRNVPLSEALRYVAQLAGLELEADENSIVLKPVGPQVKATRSE